MRFALHNMHITTVKWFNLENVLLDVQYWTAGFIKLSKSPNMIQEDMKEQSIFTLGLNPFKVVISIEFFF